MAEGKIKDPRFATGSRADTATLIYVEFELDREPTLNDLSNMELDFWT